VEEGLFLAPIFCGVLQVIKDNPEVVSQVVTDFLLAALFDVAEVLKEVVVDSLDVIGVRLVDLESYVFDGLIIPELELMGGDHHEGESEFHQNSADVFGTLLPGVLLLDGDVNESERTVKRFCAHELSSAC
jgi:hypothetical protein